MMRNQLRAVLVVKLLQASFLGAQGPTDLEDLVRTGDVFMDPEIMEPFNGSVVRYWESGRKRVTAELVEGLTTGEVKMYHRNGEIAYEGIHIQGKPDGLEKTFYESGIPFEERYYSHGVYHGPFRKFYANDGLSYSGSYKQGRQDGLWLRYYEDGSLNVMVHFRDGFQHGPVEDYTPSGELRTKGMMENGLQCGIWLEEMVSVDYPACDPTTHSYSIRKV